jgi:hypothetical protein
MLFGKVVELWGMRYAIWECSRQVMGNEVCYLGM